MRFAESALPGAYLVHLEPDDDERGFFARAFCELEFGAHGLATRYPQCNLSRNLRRGTLRGMHYNAAPHEEAKLVRCVAGAIHDVIVDLREGSPTRLRWTGIDLSAESGVALYVPPGFAHGFLSLEDDTDVFYQMSELHAAGAGRGFRWNDPTVAITWPFLPIVMSERDRTYPDLAPSFRDG